MKSPETNEPLRVVVGTAGHIDHGKTSLVLALTGIDCDRWAEEKARGITIDLGFAHLAAELEGRPLQIGFVDVPGHERFLANALAGLGGIRVVLLVVAADEGVKPQTREHLAIAGLLGLPRALVALTKIDAVDPDLAELARLEVEELLAPTPFRDAPIFAVSSLTGEGLPELRAELVAVAGSQAVKVAKSDPARLPIDRAFHLKGQGVVVTGTLAQGEIAPGDAVEILPGPQLGSADSALAGRVRGVHVHGQARERARAGERSAVQLAGVELESLARGQQLGPPGAFATTARLLARLELLPDAPAPIRGWTAIRVHLLAAEAVGKVRPLGQDAIAPGETGLCELRLGAPLVAVRGDRWIARRPSPEATVGGGVILDPAPTARRIKDLAAAAQALEAGLGEGSDAPALLIWARAAGIAGLEPAEAARRLGRSEARVSAELTKLVAANRLIAVPARGGRRGGWVAPSAVQEVADRAKKLLTAHFKKDRLSRGLPKAEAVRRLFPGRAAESAEVFLEWLAAQKVLVVEGDLVTQPGRGSELTQEESGLAKAVLERFTAAGLTPDSPAELLKDLTPKNQILEGVVRFLVQRGQLIKLPGGLVLAAPEFRKLRQDLLATGWERFNVAQFKDHFGLTRKWAIPLLEQLDSVGATRRAGDDRLVVRPRV